MSEITPYSEVYGELWLRANLSYKLDSLQKKIRKTIYDSNSDSICILSARQIGKSFVSTVIGLEHCLEKPGRICRILSPTLKQTSDIVNDNLNKILQDAPPGLIVRQKSEYRWQIGESTLRLGSLERANVDNNRGGNATLCIFEEGGFVPSEDYKYAIESVISPQLLRSKGREIHISSPSEDEYHYLHEVVAPKCDSTGTLFRYTIYDSPSIDDSQIQKAAQRCGGFESESFLREYLAQIIGSKTLKVIPEYNDDLHSAEFELPEYYKAVVVWDMGGIKDKTALLSCVWDWQSARLMVWDEHLLDPNTPTRDIVIKSKQLEAGLEWGDRGVLRWADVPTQLTIDLPTLFNCPVTIPPKDDRDAQINAVRLAFTHGKILIHKRCVNLRGNLQTARYNNKRTDFERHTLYGHCDPLMALVYANRVIDKKTIPLPERVINRENKIYLPHRTKSDPHLMDVANSIAPYNPLKRHAKRV